MPAKIVIDENSGIIVMGKDVRVSTVAVAQSNLTVTIAESPIVVQPEPAELRRHRRRAAHRPRRARPRDSNLALVPESVTLQELVDGLNALGISPRDLIAILQAIKAAGRAAGRDRGALMAIRLDLRAPAAASRPPQIERCASRPRSSRACSSTP